jgi:hypothetical protein
LGRWTDAEQPLSEFIASQLGDLGEHLNALLGERLKGCVESKVNS